MNDMGEVMALIVILPLLSIYWAYTIKAIYNIIKYNDPFGDD